MARTRTAPLVVLVAVLVACTGSDDGSSATTSTSTTTTTTTTSTASAAPAAGEEEWTEIDEAVAELAPEVGLLVARVTEDEGCEPIHEVASTTARPTASQFKLFVLGAVAEQIAAGELAWDETLTVTDAVKSLGNGEGTGSLQFEPAGTEVTVEEAATKMISISDNTATDMLIDLVARDAVEARMADWVDEPSANVPFLTTRQMFLLHYSEGLGERWLATAPEDRAAFLAEEVDPLPISAVGSGYTDQPAFVTDIEWFASPTDICDAFAGLQTLAQDPALVPLPAVLEVEDGTLDLPADDWPTVWFKGGSEPGVLTLGWLATTAEGETYVVEAMLTDPDAPLADTAITDLVAVSRDAFTLLAS